MQSMHMYAYFATDTVPGRDAPCGRGPGALSVWSAPKGGFFLALGLGARPCLCPIGAVGLSLCICVCVHLCACVCLCVCVCLSLYLSGYFMGVGWLVCFIIVVFSLCEALCVTFKV